MVRSRMPATRPLEGGRLINGAQALLVREGIGFAGFEYRADYYFQNGEYLQVSLIRYIPFPDALKGKYQSFTEADISRLREAGYEEGFLDVDEGVSRYVHWMMENL